MPGAARTTFFGDAGEDDGLEPDNAVFWDALLVHVARDLGHRRPVRVLDVGCHRGGLLARMIARWRPNVAIGVEPIENLRKRAKLRLQGTVAELHLLTPDEWDRVPAGTVDILVSHESLYLDSSLADFMARVKQCLAPEAAAYIVLGCHPENPVWPEWRRGLETLGHVVYDHRPIDILAAAARAGLIASVRPLREVGWATHDPTSSSFTFPSVAALLDHQFRHKLLFRLMPR